ncbi:Mucin-2 [Lobaria immixta]|nr:Mucin-2 [Lobaria immixta]
MNSTQCGFDGNPDIYGAGIRIGYYTQILSIWIANYFVLSESKSLRSVNILFMLALFIGTAWQSRRPSRIYAIEAFLLIQLLCATWYIGVLEKSRYSKKYWRFSPARLIFRNLTLMGLLAYNVWFWWNGLDLMSPTPCGTWIFFMAKVNLYGWYRSAFKVLSLTAISFHAVLTVGHAAQLTDHWRGKHMTNPDYYRALRQDLLKNEGLKRNGSGNCSDPAVISLEGAAANSQSHQGKNESSARNSHHRSEQSSVATDQPESINLATVSADATDHQPLDQENGSLPRERRQTTATQQPAAAATQSSLAPAATASQMPNPITTQPSPPSYPTTAAAAQKPTPTATQSSSPSPATTTQTPKHAGSQSAPQPATVSTPATVTIILPSLAELLSADAYLTNILESTDRTPTRTYRIPHTPISISFPSFHLLSSLPSPRPSLRPLQILTPLLLHTYALRSYPLHTYPSLIRTALLTPQHTLLSPLALRTCIAFHVSQLPATNRVEYSLLSAASTLLVVVGLVLAIELSIVWNGIRHTSDVGAVGQLVPAVIGVGGLLKVLWTWWRCGRDDGGGLRHAASSLEEEKDGIAREAVDCAEVYDRLKTGRAEQDV